MSELLTVLTEVDVAPSPLGPGACIVGTAILDELETEHRQVFEVVAVPTELGDEEITRDVPNVTDGQLARLDEHGVIRIGTHVQPGDLLVGKVAPRAGAALSHEEKLLRAIFGEAAGDVVDRSLRVPPGVEGTVTVARREPPHKGEPGASRRWWWWSSKASGARRARRCYGGSAGPAPWRSAMIPDVASFPEPWPQVFELLDYAKDPAALGRRKKLPLSGMLGRKVPAAQLCGRISTLAPLVHLPGLEEIVLCGARLVDDLGPLAGLDGLRSLIMWKTGIRSLEPLRGKAKLRELAVWCTEIESLQPVATMERIEVLDVEFTRVHDLEPLSGLTKLRELNISGTEVRSLAPLRDVPLTQLDAFHTPLDAREIEEFRLSHPTCHVGIGDAYPGKATRCGC